MPMLNLSPIDGMQETYPPTSLGCPSTKTFASPLVDGPKGPDAEDEWLAAAVVDDGAVDAGTALVVVGAVVAFWLPPVR